MADLQPITGSNALPVRRAGLLLGMWLSGAIAPLPSRAVDLTLDAVLARARERAPAVLAARVQIDEARGRLRAAAVLLRDNPQIEGAGGARATGRGEQLEGDVGVKQMFEVGGQRAARIAGAEAGVTREVAQSADAARRVLRDAAVAFYQLLHVTERLRLAEEAAHVASETVRVAQRRHQAGDVAVLDVNVASIAAARARADVQRQHAALAAAQGQLRLLLDLDAEEPIEIRGQLADRRRYDVTELLARAPDRGDLRALAAEVRAAEADEQLGKAARWPNVGLGARYERDDGQDVGLGSVTVVVPVFDRGEGVRAEAAARRRRLQLSLEAGRRLAGVEIRSAYESYRRREAAVTELERDALAGLDANEALARRSYAAGQLGLVELLLIRREMVETRAEYLDRQLDAAVASVELEASAGVLQ
jgi:cobalt-zinc-cadmium efflux system outer membrane protein